MYEAVQKCFYLHKCQHCCLRALLLALTNVLLMSVILQIKSITSYNYYEIIPTVLPHESLLTNLLTNYVRMYTVRM